MEGQTKATINSFIEEKGNGNFQRHNQLLKIQYLPKLLNITPKVAITIQTTEDDKPRSYRTDNPEKLRAIIKSLIKCLYQLEYELKH